MSWGDGDRVVGSSWGAGDSVVGSDESAAETARLARQNRTDPQAFVRGWSTPDTPEQQNALSFGAGAKHALDRATLGAKGLLPEVVQQAGDAGEDWIRSKLSLGPRQDLGELNRQGAAYLADKGWRGTAGQVTGDLAMSAAPVMHGGAMLTKALGALPLMGKVAPAVADVATNAGWSAATSPEDRTQAATFGGAGAAGGRMLTRALGGLVQPAENALELLKKGVRLTPGQVGGEAGTGIMGTLAQQYEKGLASIPFLGAPVKNVRERSLDDWQRYLNEVADDARALEKARNKSGPVSRSTAERSIPQLTPTEALRAGLKADNQSLVDAAKQALPILSDTAPPSDIGKLMNASRSLLLGAVTHGVAGAAGLPLAVGSLLGTTDAGRKFLLGQADWQQVVKANPKLAAAVVQAMRAGTTQSQQPSEGRMLPRALGQPQEQ